MLISETWLSSSVFDNELFTNDYNVVRKDRHFATVGRSRGGGALIVSLHHISFNTVES